MKKNKPIMRFRGFTDDWEQRKFGSFTSTRRGLTYKPNDVDINGVLVLRSSNIKADKFVLNNDDVYVNEKCVDIEYVKQNDILITSANGSSRLVGKNALIPKLPVKAVHGGFMLLASSAEPNFVKALMSSLWYRKLIYNNIYGGNGAIGNLRQADLSNSFVNVPSLSEQVHLGKLFDRFDKTITLHQRKLDLYIELKKTILTLLFPNGNSTNPSVRFSGFTDDWEQRRLGDVAKFKQGVQVDLNLQYLKKTEETERFIRIVDYTQDTDELRYVMKDITSDRVDEKDIVMVRYGATAGFVGRGITGIIANNMFTISPNENLKKLFLYTFLKMEKIYTKLNSSNGSSAMPALNFGMVGDINLSYPTRAEQHQIGTFFKNLDNLITLHQRKLDLLKQQKQYFLKMLFV